MNFLPSTTKCHDVNIFQKFERITNHQNVNRRYLPPIMKLETRDQRKDNTVVRWNLQTSGRRRIIARKRLKLRRGSQFATPFTFVLLLSVVVRSRFS